MQNRLVGIALLISAISPALAPAQTGTWVIDTLAGRDRPVNDGGPGYSAPLNFPYGIVADSSGNIIFADSGNHRVRRISPSGTITTIAGTGQAGYTGDGGAATAATLVKPQGLALDSSGSLYIADYTANVVRKVLPDGTIITWAGTGAPGNTGNGGKATSATLFGPYALAADSSGALYIADELNSTVRKVTADGTISALTSTKFSYPEGLAVDSTGNVYVATYGDNKIYKVTPAGVVSTVAGTGSYGFGGDGNLATAAFLAGPQGLAFDATGNLWICDAYNNRLRRLSTDGKIQTIAGSGSIGLSGFSSEPLNAAIYTPVGIALDSKGLVYWTEIGNNRVRVFNPASKQITEIGGFTLPLVATGGPTAQTLFNPFSTAVDTAGNLFIADTTNNLVRKITPAGVSSIFAGTGQANFNGEVGVATATNISAPQGVAVDPQGVVYIAESGSGRVRKVDTTGRISTVMGNGTGLPFSGTFAGNAFLFTPTGVAATGNGTFAMVDQIFGIAARVDALGTITLIPTSAVNFMTYPAGIAVSGASTYIADTFGNRILKNTGSTTTVIAGTGAPGYTGDGAAANKATLFLPNGVAVDSKENIYIADTGNNVIRMIDTTGKITTIAGTGKPGFSGDKGPAALATLSTPTGVTVDASGNLLVTDRNNQRVRQLQFVQIPPDFTVGSDFTFKAANRGTSVVVPLTLSSVGGFAGSVTLTVTPPAGVTVDFSPATARTLAAGQSAPVSATVKLPATMAPDTVTLTFVATAGTVTHNTVVTINVTDAPLVTSSGIVNAGSYSGGGVAPGEIVAVYGQDLGPADLALGSFDASNVLSSTVGGTQVLFDGVPAPLVYVTAGQLSAIVPYSVAGKTTTQVQIKAAGKTSTAVAVPVTDAVPGIFNLPGVTQAASLNADLSLNNASQPAEKGSIVVLFATGEGQTSPGGVDGKIATEVFPKPVLPVTVTIGGVDAEVAYYGAAPFQVAGVMQLNVKVPTSVTSGDVPVVLKVGTKTSQAQSTIRVK